MTLRPATGWTTRLAVPGDDHTVPRSELLRDGVATGAVVEGAVLEAAVDAGHGRVLVFLTHDVPSEETLSIHLVAADGQLLDTAWLGGPMASGRFEGPVVVPPRRVEFGFLGDRRWTLTMLDSPAAGWARSLLPEGLGIHRPHALARRWFRLSSRARP